MNPTTTELRALSLTQPWASLVAQGAKRIETRSWATPYRGWIAIHAAKAFPRECQRLLEVEPFLTALNCPPDELRRGAILAVVRLRGCFQCGKDQGGHGVPGLVLPPVAPELSFGDYSPGRYAWVFDDLRPLGRPIPCKGALGGWRLPAEVETEIKKRVFA